MIHDVSTMLLLSSTSEYWCNRRYLWRSGLANYTPRASEAIRKWYIATALKDAFARLFLAGSLQQSIVKESRYVTNINNRKLGQVMNI